MREAVFSHPAVVRAITDSFVPVALKLPAILPSETMESRFFREKIYSNRWAAQGLAVYEPATGCVRWLQLWDGVDRFLSLLDRARNETGDFLNVGRALLPPPPHARGDRCPMSPPVPDGWLIADLLGRTTDEQGRADGLPTEQFRYVAESFGVPRTVLDEIRGIVAAKPGTKVRLPATFTRLVAQHAYLGQTDLRPVDNPRRGREEVTRMELWLEPADGPLAFRISGETDLSTIGEISELNAAPFRTEVRLTWRGELALAAGGGIERLTLLGRGRTKIRWDGYTDGKGMPREGALPSGSSFQIDSPVTFGLVIPGKGAVQDFGQGGPPRAIQTRMETLQAAVRKWQAAGKDLSPVANMLKRFEPLIMQGEWDRAQAVLDEALRVVEGPAR